MYSIDAYGEELYHHGVKGQKWGVRNYQNEDGSYTSAGKSRYGIGTSQRVRAKQARIQSRIDKGGDKSTLFRNTVNDYRRGRVAALKTKAEHREAAEAYRQDKTAENLKAKRAARATRLGKNVLLQGGLPMNVPVTAYRGSYNRYRQKGDGIVKSLVKTEAKFVAPQIAVPAKLVGAYDI